MWRFSAARRGFLKTLTEEEKIFLRPFISDGANIRNASMYDGVANGLKMKGIIYPASNTTIPGQHRFQVPFNLHPYVRKWLSKHRRYLDK